jgi:hypothetical protein
MCVCALRPPCCSSIVSGLIILLLNGGGGDLSSLLPTPPPVPNTFDPPGSTIAMNTLRFNATATLLPNGKVLIAGGTTFNKGPFERIDAVGLNRIELYDPATDSFAAAASLPSMNQARMDATATLLPNGKVVIAGRLASFDGINTVLDSVELYNP